MGVSSPWGFTKDIWGRLKASLLLLCSIFEDFSQETKATEKSTLRDKMFGQRGTRRIFAIAIRCILVAALIYAGTRIFRFLQLFGKFKDHSGVRLTQDEIFNAHNSSDGRTPTIPKIIHQVFHNWHDANDNTLPAEWQSMRQSCIDMNPDWEHKVRERAHVRTQRDYSN